MSNLLYILEPFRENMRIFAERYNDFNKILKIVNTFGFGGDEITQEEYYQAAQDPTIGLGPGQAEGLKDDFINICKKLAASENDIGSIKNVIQMMHHNDFNLVAISAEVADQYADYQYFFETTIAEDGGSSSGTLGQIQSFLARTRRNGVFKAIGGFHGVDDSIVQEGIDSFNTLISFLEQVAQTENLEDVAASGLYIRKHSHKPRRRRSKRSTRTKYKRKKERKRRSTRGKQKRSNKKHPRRKKNDRY